MAYNLNLQVRQKGLPFSSGNLLPIKKFSEVARHVGLDLLHVNRPAGLPGERGDAPVGDAARHDEVEEIEVCVDVQGESVHGDPPAALDAEYADFSSGTAEVDPNAREPLNSAGDDAVFRARPDHCLFEEAEVLVDVREKLVEVEDGVAHDLARTMVGVAAAVDGKCCTSSASRFRAPPRWPPPRSCPT